MSFRTSSHLSNNPNQTGARFSAAATKILARMFVLPLCLSFLDSASVPPLEAAALPNRVSYDFDGNGISDLLWRDSQNGDLAIWLMDGAARPSKALVAAPRIAPEWQIAGVGDLDADTKADLVWRNTQTGEVAEWLMDGTTVKTWSTLSSGISQEWQIAGIGDLDGDGKADLVWRNTQTGDVAEWLVDGATVKAWSTLSSGIALEWQIAGIGDLDGDGKADLVWRNTQSGDVAEWLIIGTTVTARPTLALGLHPVWQIAGIGDFDGDGKADLVWRNMQSGEIAEWLINGPALKSWSLIEPGPQWANKPFSPVLADHLEVSLFSVELTSFTLNQTTLYEYSPKLRLTETEGKIGISVSVRLTANGGSNFTPPLVRRIEAGTTKEVLNNDSGGIVFTANISSVTAQISFTDDAGRTGSVTVSAPTSDSIYPAVPLTWKNQ
jgi:hypothetical protein